MRSENASALLYVYFYEEILSTVMRVLRERAHRSQFDRTALSVRWATVHFCCRSQFVIILSFNIMFCMMLQVRNTIMTGYYQPLSPPCSLGIVVPA
jgi:hypothetical protein